MLFPLSRDTQICFFHSETVRSEPHAVGRLLLHLGRVLVRALGPLRPGGLLPPGRQDVPGAGRGRGGEAGRRQGRGHLDQEGQGEKGI